MFEFIENENIAGLKRALLNFPNDDALQIALNQKNSAGQTLLHAAVLKGSLEMVQMLLAWDISLTEVDAKDKTALKLAEEKRFSSHGDYEKVIILLKTRLEWQNISAQRLRFNHTVRLIKAAFPAIMPANGKDKVLLVGRTGAGKSTLANYLNGTQYIIETDPKTGKTSAQPLANSQKEIARVGQGMISQTLYPQVVKTKQANCVYCDLAGLFDSRGNELRICAASTLQLLSRLPGDIKGILVVLDLPSFLPKGDAFKKLSVALAQMLQQNAELMESVYFIITQVPKAIENTIDKTAILEEYVEEILYNLDDKAKTQTLDTEEQALQFMLNQMVNRGEKQILIANITDNGTSREKIEQAISNLKTKNANLFNFVTHDSAQESFNTLLAKLAQEFSKRCTQLATGIPEKIAKEEQMQNKATIKIKELKNKIEKIEEVKTRPYYSAIRKISYLEAKLKQNPAPNNPGEAQANERTRQEIAWLQNEKKELELNNACLDTELAELRKIVAEEEQKKKTSVSNVIKLKNELQKTRIELEVNRDLFTTVYEVTILLDLGSDEAIACFWQEYANFSATTVSATNQHSNNQRQQAYRRSESFYNTKVWSTDLHNNNQQESLYSFKP